MDLNVRKYMYYYKLLAVMGMVLSLAACGGTILEGYDEFRECKSCMLTERIIRTESSIGFSGSRRHTLLTLARQSNNIIECTISVRAVEKYPTLSKYTKAIFKITDRHKNVTKLVLKTYGYRYGRKIVYDDIGYGITLSRRAYNAIASFKLTTNQLQQIVAAKKVNFEFATNKKPIKGYLGSKDRKLLEQFLATCMSS